MIDYKVSIITVCYNCRDDIEKTIISVVNQTYCNTEYIIIDGNSNDGTNDIIKKYRDQIDVVIREPDQGIYDAMNKGVDHSSGNWLIFMNGGDLFYRPDVVSEVFNNVINDDVMILYGRTSASYNQKEVVRKPKNLQYIYQGMIACHQSMFFKRQVFENFFYNTEYNITADYDLTLKCYLENFGFMEINTTISLIDTTGISNHSTRKIYYSYVKILSNNEVLSFMNATILAIKISLSILRDTVLCLLPKAIANKIRLIKNYHHIKS